MAKNGIPVQDLDFDRIKANLKTFLKNQDKFQDYDFEGSALSIHMDLLAYVTHYGGFHAHMLNNESNIDSANLKSSMTSKAKFQNYIPGSRKSAEATVTFEVDVDAGTEPTDRKIVIPRGTSIKSNNNISDSRDFILVDDLYIYNQSMMAGSYDYTSDEVRVYEGSFESQRFVVDGTMINQRYIIRDPNVDIKTIRVKVYDSKNDSNYTTFKLASDFMSINGTSPVFFLTVNEDDHYELQFGNGVYGQALSTGNMIDCTFISSNGEDGNNARSFTFGGDLTYDNQQYTVTISTVTPSEGGMEAEGVDDLRFNIPYHYRRQNRAVVTDDYRELLMNEYRNINSINVWGGEDADNKAYGKVFICIKPKFGEVLSSKAKENLITRVIKKRNVSTIEPEIVDPEYLYVNLDVYVQFNPIETDKSSGEVRSAAQAAITNYNTNVLNRFNSFYSDLELNSRVRASNPAILTSYTKIKLAKRFEPTLHSKQTYFINYLNSILPSTVKSDEFMFRMSRCYMKDDGVGNIHIWFYNETNNDFQVYPDEIFGQVDYTLGEIRLIDFEVNGLYDTGKTLRVTAQPAKPDFFAKRNNIVVIENAKLTVTEHFENENDR